MKTKFAIGCLVQWYEVNIIDEYIDSLKDAIDNYDGEVMIDFVVCLNQDLEKCINEEQLELCKVNIVQKLMDVRFKTKITNNLTTISDYRREFNNTYCEQADVLIWGETDAIFRIFWNMQNVG